MSRWEKLLKRIYRLDDDLRFDELKKVLEHYGYEMHMSGSGGSHCTFRKDGKEIITIPRHRKIKKVYIEMVRDIIESEDKI